MAVPDAQAGVIRTWFGNPQWERNQAVADALFSLITVANASDATLNGIATDRLLGRDTAGTGAVEEIAVGGGLEFTGSGGIRIASSGVTAATYGDASNVAQITVGADGRITSASNVPIAAAPGGTDGQVQFNDAGSLGGFTVGGDATLDTSTGTLTLANSGVTADTYGSTTAIPVLVVDAKGRITGASEVSITAGLTVSDGYWSPLTDGDAASPELIFDGDGDVIAIWTET